MLRNLTKRSLLPWIGMWVLISVISVAGQKSSKPLKSTSPLATAKAQLDHGDLDSAEKTLWSILSAEPTNSDALTVLGVVRVRQQRYAEAEALFRRVLQLNPKSVVASQNLADVLLAQEKPIDAIQQYKQTVQLAPQDTRLKIELAQLDIERGDFAEALSTLDSIKPSRFPTAAIALKAASLLGLSRKSDAEGLIPLVGGSSASALELAEVFVEANDPDAALKSLSFVNSADKRIAARSHYLEGRALRQEQKTAAAMNSFRLALAADPKSVETLVAMAEILAIENKHADSFAMLEKARALNPDSLETMRHLIVEAMRSGENNKALLAAQDLQSKSSELDDKYLVASVMLQQKQFLAASHILEDYVAQRPDDAKAFLGLGMAYLNLLRYADAREALEHSLQLKPDLAEADYQLGILLAQQSNRQQAIASWQKAVELQPNHAQALFSLGTVYLETGELEKAQTAFLGSLAADPNNMKTEYDVALVLNKLGKPGEARQHFERYRRMQAEEHSSNGNPASTADHP